MERRAEDDPEEVIQSDSSVECEVTENDVQTPGGDGCVGLDKVEVEEENMEVDPKKVDLQKEKTDSEKDGNLDLDKEKADAELKKAEPALLSA